MFALLLNALLVAAAPRADPPDEPETAPAVSISPRSGRAGTEATITLSEAAGAGFDGRTTATWRGRYVPIVGEPSRTFEVRFNARQFRETGPGTATVTLGEGDFKNAPNPLGIKGPGGLRGTLTLHLSNDEEIKAPLDLALEIGADWRWPEYPDGPRGIYPPELGGETEGLWPVTLSHAPEPTNPDPDRLMVATGHYAAVVQIPETPAALASAPDIILADLVSFGPGGAELQRIIDVPLYRWDDDGDPKRITWCNDLTRPIVLVDTPLDQSKYPDVIVMLAVTGGSAVIAPIEGVDAPDALARINATRKPSDWAPPQILPEAVALIETEARGELYKAVEAAGTLAGVLPDGDYATWRRLRPLVESRDIDGRLRTAIFKAFRGKQDQRIADEMLAMALEASAASLERRARMAQREEGAGEQIDWTPVFIIRDVFADLQQPPLRELILASEGALQLIENVALGAAMVHPSPSGDAVRLLRDGPYPDEAKARVALNIILARGSGGWSEPVLIGLLDLEEALPALRGALVESGAEYETLHWGAAHALVQLGDLEARPLIEAKARGADDPKLAAGLEYAIWQIEIQHPPEQLLERIAATTDPPNRPLQRPWAIRRAVELGLPKEEIRRAILSYMADPQPVRWQDPRTGEWYTAPPLVGGIKEAGMELGVLRAGDVPGIRMSDPETRPHW